MDSFALSFVIPEAYPDFLLSLLSTGDHGCGSFSLKGTTSS